jgi:hypothetical protein
MPRPLYRPRVILRRWSDAYTGDLKAARALFERTFGFAHDDKQHVDETIADLFKAELFKSARGNTPDATVPIPAKLVLALMLRKGFGRNRGRGYLRQERANRARIIDAVLATQDLLPRFLEQTNRQRYTYEAAKKKAAEQVARECGIPAATILRKENWISRRRSRAKT